MTNPRGKRAVIWVCEKYESLTDSWTPMPEWGSSVRRWFAKELVGRYMKIYNLKYKIRFRKYISEKPLN